MRYAIEKARECYGVVIDPASGVVDVALTALVRSKA